MHFTRDPVIETIISPREGYNLVLRNTTGEGQEFVVDMVEVISFGNQSLYRSLDRPNSFIVPVSDYQVVEVRETRIALKTPTIDQGIKIAGGKEANKKEREAPVTADSKGERRKRRSGRKQSVEPVVPETVEEGERALTVEKPIMLLPPPTTLISETLSRYKEMHVADEEKEASRPDIDDLALLDE